MQQVDCAMLTTSEVFHQAHDQAILDVGIDDESRNFVLAQRLVGFEPSLTAHEVVAWTVRVGPAGDSYRLLQPKFAHVRNDFLEDFLVADSRIDHGDAINGNHFNGLGFLGSLHATSIISARAVKPKNASSVSKRLASSNTPLSSASP